MTAPLGYQLLSLSVSLDQSLEHIFVYLINRDKTHIVELVLTSHCTKTLMQCLFFDISCSPPPSQVDKIIGSEIFVYILPAELQETLVKFKEQAIMYLQIELIPNIKRSMIKNLLGSLDTLIPHSRVQSNTETSRPPILKSLVY